jgi:hypothetical protein
MSETKQLVMVASLERHLHKERTTLYEALMAQGCIPTGLPFPQVAANYLWKLNQLAITDADYVFLMVGNEYGPLSEKGVGYLHQVYAAARAAHKTVVAFLYTGVDKPSLSLIDQTRLSELVAQLKSGIHYNWRNEDELRDAAERAMERVLEEHPASGWHRTPDAAVKNRELRLLREQLAELRRELEEGRSDAEVDLRLFDDPSAHWQCPYTCKAFREGQLKVLKGEVRVTWRRLFSWLAPALLSPLSEARVATLLSEYLQPMALLDIKSRWPGSHAVADVKPERAALDVLKLQLRSMALVRFDAQGHWRLTDAGESVALKTLPAMAGHQGA